MHSSLSWWSVFLTVSYSIKVEDKLKLVYIQGPSPEKKWSKLMSKLQVILDTNLV